MKGAVKFLQLHKHVAAYKAAVAAEEAEYAERPLSSLKQVVEGCTIKVCDTTMSRTGILASRERGHRVFHDGSGLDDVVARYGTPLPVPAIDF